MHIELDVLMVGKRLTDKRESELANQALHRHLILGRFQRGPEEALVSTNIPSHGR